MILTWPPAPSWTDDQIRRVAADKAAQVTTRGGLLLWFPPEGLSPQADKIRLRWEPTERQPLTDLDREMLGYLWIRALGRAGGYQGDPWYAEVEVPEIKPPKGSDALGWGVLLGAVGVLGALALWRR